MFDCVSTSVLRRRCHPLAFLVGLIATLATHAAARPRDICVRNYASESAADPCAMALPQFTYVIQKKSPGLKICTRIFDKSYCKRAPKEYWFAIPPKGEPVCVINFRQDTGNYCGLGLKEFVYATSAY